MRLCAKIIQRLLTAIAKIPQRDTVAGDATSKSWRSGHGMFNIVFQHISTTFNLSFLNLDDSSFYIYIYTLSTESNPCTGVSQLQCFVPSFGHRIIHNKSKKSQHDSYVTAAAWLREFIIIYLVESVIAGSIRFPISCVPWLESQRALSPTSQNIPNLNLKHHAHLGGQGLRSMARWKRR